MARVNKNAGTLAAQIAGEMSEMDDAEHRLEAAVRSEAERHRRTGAFQASINSGRVPGKRGVTDREVWTDDPAAWSIEYGHRAPDGTDVPGKFIFTNALRRF